MTKASPKIPGLFNYLSKTGSNSIPLYPLDFNPESEPNGHFTLAKKKISFDSFRPRRFDVNLKGVENRSIKYKHMRDYPLLVSNKGMKIVGPVLNEYAQSVNSENEVVTSLGSLGLSFAYNNTSPGFGLSVIESGATIGPAIENSLIDPPIGEYGFFEYVYMGDKDRSDRLILLAGLGHLARLARPIQD